MFRLFFFILLRCTFGVLAQFIAQNCKKSNFDRAKTTIFRMSAKYAYTIACLLSAPYVTLCRPFFQSVPFDPRQELTRDICGGAG